MSMTTFEQLGLSESMLEVLSHKGFEAPSPIQTKVIPFLLNEKRDVIAQAQTGTGKTAAFGIPILEKMTGHASHVQVIVLTPTRELAIQVAEEIHSLRGKKNIRITPVYGGQSISQQLRRLKQGVDFVVGTPGRILDHIRKKALVLDKVDYLVLDEADEMLNMGFIEDVAEIMAATNPNRRTMMFSATMPAPIQKIANRYMKDYHLVKANREKVTVTSIDQIYFEVSERDKFEALCRIIDVEEDFYGVIFCRTRVDTDEVAKHLNERGYDADALNGDIPQAMRERILNRFKKRTINILVATDVAARGIDVQDLTHVINYSLPQDPEAYVHRIGRTGRAGKEGNAITFVTPQEYKRLRFIQRVVKTDIRKAKIPKVTEVIAAKKSRVKTALIEVIQSQPSQECYSMTDQLLKNHSPEDVIAALVQCVFEDELREDQYAPISEVTVDKTGKTRLFISQGRNKGLSPKKLAVLIEDKCGVKQRLIRDIKVKDNFSFMTLPFHEAEVVLKYFKKNRKHQGLSVSKAKG